MASRQDLLTATQNIVSAINGLQQQLKNAFPGSTASSSTVSAGAITFSSSQASGFLIVQTSSGATVKVPFYPQ
jgi:hypothetical protein